MTEVSGLVQGFLSKCIATFCALAPHTSRIMRLSPSSCGFTLFSLPLCFFCVCLCLEVAGRGFQFSLSPCLITSTTVPHQSINPCSISDQLPRLCQIIQSTFVLRNGMAMVLLSSICSINRGSFEQLWPPKPLEPATYIYTYLVLLIGPLKDTGISVIQVPTSIAIYSCVSILFCLK